MSARKKKVDSKAGRGRRQPASFFDEPPPGLFPSGDEVLKFFVVVALAASVAVACHFVTTFRPLQQRPFCDSGDEPQDFCEPCPDHAECIRGRCECLLGYKKKGRRCVDDGEINQKLEILSELIEAYTCAGYAQFLCYHSGITWFSEANLLKMLDEHRQKLASKLNNDSWDLLSQRAMKAAEISLDMRISAHGTKEARCPDSLVELHKPYSCLFQQWVRRNVVFLAPVFLLMPASVLLLLRLRRQRYISSRAEELYELVCEILRDSTSSGGEHWVGLSWLRDQLLLPRERKDTVLWRKVEELIVEDSRIDQYPKIIKGEQKIVLEWQVEGFLSSERMMTKASVSRTRAPKEKDLHQSALQKSGCQVGQEDVQGIIDELLITFRR